MDPSSPTKRRALGPLDANAMSPAASKMQLGKPGSSPIKPPLLASPAARALPEPRKRPLEEPRTGELLAKKLCQEPEVQRAIGHGNVDMEETDDSTAAPSPDTSSIFDTSANDTTQATTITEPDVEQARVVRPRQPALLTREQARQKAEILRLRLGLASYKLKTGQEDVPLERLQLKPVLGKRPLPIVKVSAPQSEAGTQPSSSQSSNSSGCSSQESIEDARSTQEEEKPERKTGVTTPSHPSPEKGQLPRLPAQGLLHTPQRTAGEDDKLTSSALRGGAVSGLLSLARSSS